MRFSAEGVRLDQAVAEEAKTSRSRAQAWIEQGAVRVDGKVITKASFKLKGETVELEPPPESPSTVAPEAIPLEVLFEDQDLLVVNKPPGMITHPARGVTTGTLVNAVLGRYGLEAHTEALPELVRPGIVHRLDKDTSGVMVVARHEAAHRRLAGAFKDRRVFKRYLAITEGFPAEGVLSAPIGRHPVDKTKMHVQGVAGRYAETELGILAKSPNYALIDARPHTGRTHQIRVHLKHLRAPIVGDKVYGKPSPAIGRQALHAYELRFPHPRTGKLLEFCAPVPSDMVKAWEAVGGHWPEGIQLSGD